MSKNLKLPTLLVISDNPSIRFWVKKHVEDQFFIIHAESKQAALNALQASLDFIVLDAALEDCDALELASALRNLTQKNMVPILLITGRLKKAFRDKALASGITSFLSDQLDESELHTRIEEGQKASTSRNKTEALVTQIKLPKLSDASLKNKLVLQEPAARLFSDAKSAAVPMALLLIDIDTERENEEIQRLVFAFIKQFLRPKDMIVQAPGQGWAIILYNIAVDQAKKVAEKLRKNIEQHTFVTAHGAKKLTISIVVSTLEASEKSFHKTVRAAAKSLQAQSKPNLIIAPEEDPL